MPIPRLQLFEFEDQSWFPTVIRDLCTDYIHFIEVTFRLHRPVVPPLATALRTTQSEHVVDLCSGGGGPIPALQRALAAEGLDLQKQAWLLKNSLARNPQKRDRVRMPYKRFSPISDTFLVTPFGSVFRASCVRL